MSITFGMSIPLILGAQVGTCITALLSSLGTSNNGKRTALLNLYYNLLKAIPFMVIFYTLNHFIGFSFLQNDVGGIGIPLFHSLVNILASIIWLPLSGMIVALANLTIPLSESEIYQQANKLTMLDDNLLSTPSIALDQTDKALLRLSETVEESFLSVIKIHKEPQAAENVRLMTERADKYNQQIDSFLTDLSRKELGKKEHAHMSLLSTANIAFGRMAKVAGRLLNLSDSIYSSVEKISETDHKQMIILGQAIYEIMQLTINGFNLRATGVSQSIRYYREEIMELSSTIKRNFIRRFHDAGIEHSTSTLYTDICDIEEQLIDYCDMIADGLMRYNKESGHTNSISDEKIRAQVHEAFKDKFEALQSL
jgi:phosphate:Na+ symporter